jgi:hypothetical protein
VIGLIFTSKGTGYSAEIAVDSRASFLCDYFCRLRCSDATSGVVEHGDVCSYDRVVRPLGANRRERRWVNVRRYSA